MAAALLAAGLLVPAGEARAFAPEPRPWAPTPERFLRTVPDAPGARLPEALAQAGFRAWSFRPNAQFAFAYRAAGPELGTNVSPEAAGEEALALARRMARDLRVRPEDLSLASVHPLDGFTTVFVEQSHDGVPVPRGFLVFGFTGGALTSARNELFAGLRVDMQAGLLRSEAERFAMTAAVAWSPSAKLVGAARRAIWVPEDEPADARLVWEVPVSSAAPRAELTVHVDAQTGAILAAADAVRHADGEGRVRMRVHPVNPDSSPEPFTAVDLSVAGLSTDGDGELVAPGAHTVTYEGPWARIQDASGRPTERLDLTMSGPYQVYDLVPGELTQADPFVHVNVVKAWARRITPSLGWLTERLTVNVNIDDTCNAFWDGRTVNFFRAGGPCNNTGQISSIVYHEFGHGYHGNLTRNVVGSVGEGTGDFIAATVLDDPVVGRGFSSRGDGIRRIDGDNRFPDDYVGQVHEDGLIWATALWDLREALVAKHGAWAGRIIADRAFVRAVARGPGLATAYPAILEGDDDDGDITNGTPSSCEINAAFAAHGLVESGQIQHDPVPGIASPRIVHEPPGRLTPDAAGAVELSARVQNASSCGAVDPQALELWTSVEGGPWTQVGLQISQDLAVARIEGLEPGQAIAYRWRIEADGQVAEEGSEQSPHRLLVDPGLTEMFAEGFEAGFAGWTHGVLQGDLRSDWEVAEPLGRSFDPFAAKEGRFVVGTDLGDGGGHGGSDGAAKAGRPTFLESPPLSTEGMESIHLELWQHFALAGAARVLVDGQEVFRYEGAGDTWSEGWRYLAIPLGEGAADRADLVVRFEVEPRADNALGGWALDDLRLSGVEIPPPPPPPPPEMPEPPPPEVPGQVPVDPNPEPGPADPEEPAPEGFSRNWIGGGCTCARPAGAAGGFGISGLVLALAVLRRRRPARNPA